MRIKNKIIHKNIVFLWGTDNSEISTDYKMSKSKNFFLQSIKFLEGILWHESFASFEFDRVNTEIYFYSIWNKNEIIKI